MHAHAQATSADNVLMAVDATVIWRITDADTAAKNSAETISKTGADESGTPSRGVRGVAARGMTARGMIARGVAARGMIARGMGAHGIVAW
jgi:hypothetical protein